jgi:EAL domain-containing protein (putative c-di-GMP-specific phosphodiesterase class I)/DNA-binding SARP family transcriptional activator/AmiR/NasT family two-component response regulator
MLAHLAPRTTRVVLLGRLSIDRDGDPSASASLPGRRAELVFAYLAAEHRRTVSRDELGDALWPDRLPDTWAAALRGVMSDVRRFLDNGGLDAANVLMTERSGYRLALPDDVVVDLDEARSELVAARALLAADDAAQAAARAHHAAELSALPFLPHHDGVWVDSVRSELESLHTSALELQVHALADAGNPRAAAVVAERLVRAEPFSEIAHQLRISVLADADDRAGALKAYEHCVAVLGAELGVKPSADTDALIRRVLDQDRGQRPPARTAREPEQAAAPSSPTAGAGPFAALSVLVVEDHPFQRRTALALLRGLGVGTLSGAEDGNAALEWLAASSPPDVIICDIDMPGMDGVEFIRRVAQRGLASAVAIASGLDRRLLNAIQSVAEGYGLQILGAVEKPLTARRLTELLDAYRAPPRRDADRAPAELSTSALAEALSSGAVGAAYQPIVDLASGSISAVQLVARWSPQPGAEPIDQAAFEHLLEEEAVTAAFVDRAVELLCDDLDELDGVGDAIGVWLTIPDAGLADLTLADRVVERVRACGADPRRIVCAISARALQRDSALHVLARLRVMGFGLCLDDFGGGHATIEQLERIPLTAARIAQELIRDVQGDPARFAALQDAVDLARELDLPVTGAGCATAGDFERLLQVGCDFGQGDAIAAAMDAARLASWAVTWTPPLAEDHR